MATVMVTAVLMLLVGGGVLASWKWSLRRRLDEASHDDAGDPERARAYREIQKDIDRGKSASQGFFF